MNGVAPHIPCIYLLLELVYYLKLIYIYTRQKAYNALASFQKAIL